MDEIIDRIDEQRQLEQLLHYLTPREMQVVQLYWYEGYSLKEVGKIMGVTVARVQQINAKALRKMKMWAERTNKS